MSEPLMKQVEAYASLFTGSSLMPEWYNRVSTYKGMIEFAARYGGDVTPDTIAYIYNKPPHTVISAIKREQQKNGR